MSDVSQGYGWWQASDGKWYAPESHPDYVPSPVASPPATPEPWSTAAPSGPTAEPAKNSRKGLIVAGSIAGVILLIIIVSVASGSKKNNTAHVATTAPTGGQPAISTTTLPPVTTTTSPADPGINQVAKDGDFAFTITGVQCGLTTVGTDGFTKDAPAGSQWCLATMNVLNDKDTSQTFFASNQKAIDASGRQLDADDDALIYMNQSSSALSQINPGISITAVVPFQLTTGDTITSFELHDSAFSGGVKVRNA